LRLSRKIQPLMKAKGHIPVRTCISCGKKRPRHELIRLICDGENRLIRDDSGGAKGRGAYICETPSCTERLWINKRLNKHFRTEREISVSEKLTCITAL
jgi:uncharacterized protein